MVPGRGGSGRLATRGPGEDHGWAGRRDQTDHRTLGKVGLGAGYREVGGNSVGQTCLQGKKPQPVLHKDSGGTEARIPQPLACPADLGCRHLQPVEQDLPWAWVSLPSTVLTVKKSTAKS